jgi:c-di-GMP phosphodiesterase
MGETKTRNAIKHLKPYNIKLLAEKVETHEEFQYLRELGCDYFQGFFFNKPNTVAGKRLGVNQTAAIRLLTIINDPGVEFEKLSKTISLNGGLSYKLLHYINSAFFALPSKIESIHHAISYLGFKKVKRWSNILTLEALECVINYEHWNLSGMYFRNLDQKLISEAYFKSITWAKDVLGNLD